MKYTLSIYTPVDVHFNLLTLTDMNVLVYLGMNSRVCDGRKSTFTSMSRSCAAYAIVDTPGKEKDALDMICIFESMHLNYYLFCAEFPNKNYYFQKHFS